MGTSKIYYRITEAAKEIGVEPSTLRWWEREIEAFNPARTPGGRRKYTAADLETARKIKTLVYDRGMRLEAVSEFLKNSASKGYNLYCKNANNALNFLSKLREFLPDNDYALDLIEAVEKFIKREK